MYIYTFIIYGPNIECPTYEKSLKIVKMSISYYCCYGDILQYTTVSSVNEKSAPFKSTTRP